MQFSDYSDKLFSRKSEVNRSYNQFEPKLNFNEDVSQGTFKSSIMHVETQDSKILLKIKSFKNNRYKLDEIFSKTEKNKELPRSKQTISK